MSDLDPALRSARPLVRSRRSWRTGLFGTPANTTLTVLTAAALVWLLLPFARWATLDATWSGTAADCAARDGACWAFLGAKLRFILFAFYPPDLQWRPVLVLLMLGALLAATATPRFWRRELLLAWPLVIAAAWLLMAGTIAPPTVGTNQWGGLPVTMLVWAGCFAAAVPLAVLLALARRSRMAGLRLVAVAYIEVMRGIPMVAVLYFAMLILPMAVPNGQFFDKIQRAMVMITLFWAAYVAEVVRAGLQAIPAGQYEAASGLGLSYWRIMRLVVLPQALRLVIPGLVNLAIGFLLATSLLAVIGVFDLLNAARASALDPNWLGFYDESYLAVAVLYFAIGFGGSRYSLWLERRLGAAGKARDVHSGA
ncbi:amino acid ABC transporter permease [Aureimonas leprariae]|uniref:Amino acid ABC transporter permease n=1 Tax=Plantimonas leprariae TaxID=2615207 RepID=A0A7V7PNB1_9HYPH|nr:amino acid ABC transporter permease [Aureimonas leprariae]KAB0679114.1 amino acid ABC transporter permease [Aureimonas leprariae]